MSVVIGGRGRLGSAIVSSLPLGSVLVPDRAVYADWGRNDAADLVARYLERHGQEATTVFVPAGVLDPKLPEAEHDAINFRLAAAIVSGAAKVGMRTVTFGTVMETFAGASVFSPYIASKQRLASFVEGFGGPIGMRPLHLRIHTLYGGGSPNSFMFLGQILAALTEGLPFRMSSGAQLREYHHVDDDVQAILAFDRAAVEGIADISHGEPVRLKALAEAIFGALGARERLQVAALADPKADNYATVFSRNPVLAGIHFRAALPGVIMYLQSCMKLQDNIVAP